MSMHVHNRETFYLDIIIDWLWYITALSEKHVELHHSAQLHSIKATRVAHFVTVVTLVS